eukprot:scaffold5540_cov390-Prasinococcus_capsulatus_cf.AAC.3
MSGLVRPRSGSRLDEVARRARARSCVARGPGRRRLRALLGVRLLQGGVYVKLIPLRVIVIRVDRLGRPGRGRVATTGWSGQVGFLRHSLDVLHRHISAQVSTQLTDGSKSLPRPWRSRRLAATSLLLQATHRRGRRG